MAKILGYLTGWVMVIINLVLVAVIVGIEFGMSETCRNGDASSASCNYIQTSALTTLFRTIKSPYTVAEVGTSNLTLAVMGVLGLTFATVVSYMPLVKGWKTPWFFLPSLGLVLMIVGESMYWSGDLKYVLGSIFNQDAMNSIRTIAAGAVISCLGTLVILVTALRPVIKSQVESFVTTVLIWITQLLMSAQVIWSVFRAFAFCGYSTPIPLQNTSVGYTRFTAPAFILFIVALAAEAAIGNGIGGIMHIGFAAFWMVISTGAGEKTVEGSLQAFFITYLVLSIILTLYGLLATFGRYVNGGKIAGHSVAVL